MPIKVTTTPIMVKIAVQEADLSRSNAINPPKTTKIETSGIIALTPSAAPRFELSVLSVSHALNAASFALEPKKVITQSNIITKLAPTAAAETAVGKSTFITSILIKANDKIDMPHNM